MNPQTHYARSGDVSIAYQVIGDGPIDLVMVPQYVSHAGLFSSKKSCEKGSTIII